MIVRRISRKLVNEINQKNIPEKIKSLIIEGEFEFSNVNITSINRIELTQNKIIN